METDIRCLDEMAKAGQMELEKFGSGAAPYGYCPTCKQPATQCDKGTGIAKCALGHSWQAIEPGPIPDLLDPNKPVPSIQPDPDSPWLPETIVYYKLANHSGWSSPDLEAARIEAERFVKSGRPRPIILKVTETREVVT